MTHSALVVDGRSAFAEHRWSAAFSALGAADSERPLAAADLERLATAALLLGREAVGLDLLTRAHEAFLADDAGGAARCAAWIGLYLAGRGEDARAGGWFARARRIASDDRGTEATKALLLVAEGLDRLYGGAPEAAARTFERGVAAGRRAGDADATTLAQLGQGQARIQLGDSTGGLALLDEAMVAVTAGEVSAVASGIVYCSVIGSCHLAFDVRRAQQWTVALDRWCGERPDMVMFSGQCQAHRAALYRLHGAWTDAVAAARVAQDRSRAGDWTGVWGAWYEEAEVHRLRGELDAAEAGYHRAAEAGYPPQPGLSLLRLAQGRTRLAQSSIREAVEQADPATRRGLLAARVEIELAAGDVRAARDTADELASAVPGDAMPLMRALSASCDAAVRLEEDDARGALAALRTAWATWEELDAPFEAARCRVLAARAWRALGDEAAASMDLAAARDVFAELGAAPDLLRADALARDSRHRATPLSDREIEVVRLVAEGKTNRAIAGELYLSEKTVDRHLSNVFSKLGISSRAAATAYAYEHALIDRHPDEDANGGFT
jgi:DNA-binding CsgD family transcriptional regulator